MKYIKTYEKSVKYKVGDYVYIPKYIEPSHPESKILKTQVDQYNVLTFNHHNEPFETWFQYQNIVRKLIPSEIEEFEKKIKQYEIKKDANKYNL